MRKREIIEKLQGLDDEAEIVVAVITEQDSEDAGFEIGSADSNEDDEEEDDTVIDNGDGTETTFEPIYDVEILTNEDPEKEGLPEDQREKFGAIVVNMVDDEDDEDEDEEDNSESDESDAEGSQRIG